MPMPEQPQLPARLGALVSWQASRVSTLGARLFAQQLPLGARADFAVLAVIEESGPLSQADIGRHLSLDRNDVNGVLNRLEASGAVTREADPADRRRNIVTMTDRGHTYLAEIQNTADTVQAELLSALSPGEQHELQSLLAKLLEAHPGQPG